jgi:hypothetical protein
MQLTTVNAKKQGPTGETEESRLRPSRGLTGSWRIYSQFPDLRRDLVIQRGLKRQEARSED